MWKGRKLTVKYNKQWIVFGQYLVTRTEWSFCYISLQLDMPHLLFAPLFLFCLNPFGSSLSCFYPSGFLFHFLLFFHSSGSLSQQVEPLTALIQMWWHAVASGIKLTADPLFSFPPADLSIIRTLLYSCLSVYAIVHRDQSGCLLFSSYTNWGQMMCWWSLECCLPLCIFTLLPPVPWNTQTQNQTRAGVHAPSLFCQHQTHH